MVDHKHLQMAKEVIERIEKRSVRFHMAFCNGKPLDVGKGIYGRRGDLIRALSSSCTNLIYHDISNTLGHRRENWKTAQDESKKAIEQLIKDNIIEIRYI